MQVRSQVAAEREMRSVPPEMLPLEPGFIDLPQTLLDQYRRRGEASDLGKVLALANRLREQADRVIVLGVGGAELGARALFQALKTPTITSCRRRPGWARRPLFRRRRFR